MLHVVLFEPEIPENTGNVARTCVGLNATLHLIKPYGFFLDDKHLIRSGIDYWQHVKIIEHDSYNDFLKYIKQPYSIYYITRFGINTPDKIPLKANRDIYFMFGKESTGITKEILKKNKNQTVRIPATKNIRSLNLSNCVAILGYEYVRQNEYHNLEKLEPHKALF